MHLRSCCVILADRAKTRCDDLYGRAESEFSRLFPLRSPTGHEIGAALDAPRSFRTVCYRGRDAHY